MVDKVTQQALSHTTGFRTGRTALPSARIEGSLSHLLEDLQRDSIFQKVVTGETDISESKTDPSTTLGIPEGLRPALIAATAARKTVIVITASGRDAEEMAGAIRSWYPGDPQEIALLDAWETLPHERLSPRADTVASRMAVFRRLKHPVTNSSMFGPIRILIMPVRSLIQPVVAGLGDVEPLVFETGREIALDEAARLLVRNSYSRVDLVMDRGEFAVRGGILDVFPPTAAHPVRIEFFGDEVDGIHEFNASDQRTYGDSIPSIWATACRELQLTPEVCKRAASLIGQIPNAEDMLESISKAIPVEGMESLLPALVDHLEQVPSLLPDDAIVMLDDPERLRRSSDDLAKTANEFLAASWHVAASGHGSGAPIAFDEASFLDFDETLSAMEFGHKEVIRLTGFGVDSHVHGHYQLDDHNPSSFRGEEDKARSG
ncbi:MAG: transcription-repair coupling factor, partial [Bifidobacterium aquikefiri]